MGGTRDQDLSLGPWGTLGPVLGALSQRQVLHCQPLCPAGDGDVSVPPNMGGTSTPCYLFVSALAAVRVCARVPIKRWPGHGDKSVTGGC